MTDAMRSNREPMRSDARAEKTPAEATSVVPSLVVAAVSFVVILTMIIGVWLMASRRRLDAATADTGARAQAVAAGARSDVVVLLDNTYFVTPMPPTGDRSVTYQYTIAVKVAPGRRASIDELIGADRRNMMSVIREQVRRIIAAEDYLKLRAEQLDEVKRNIRHYLNGQAGGDVVEEVIFDKWNVIS